MTPHKKTKSEVLNIIQGEPNLDIRKKNDHPMPRQGEA